MKTKRTTLFSLALFTVACGVLAGCSTIRNNTAVIDALIKNDQIFVLLYADKQLNRGWLQPEGGAEEVLNNAFGVGVCSLTNSEKLELALAGKRDSTADGDQLNSSCYSSRFCGTQAYLIPGTNNQIEQFQFTNSLQENSRQFLADRFCLTPDRQTVIGCSDKPFALDANTLELTFLKSAVQCADILCEFWTNRLILEQIATVGNDLKTVAVQTEKGVGWHQFTAWNLQRSNEPRIVKVEGDTIGLEAVQLVNNKTWVLYSSVVGGIGSAGHNEANLVDEDGVLLGKTEMFGQKPIVDSDFNLVVFLKQDNEVLHIKVWHPKQNKEEIFDIDASVAMQKLYGAWKK